MLTTLAKVATNTLFNRLPNLRILTLLLLQPPPGLWSRLYKTLRNLSPQVEAFGNNSNFGRGGSSSLLCSESSWLQSPVFGADGEPELGSFKRPSEGALF